MRQLGRQLPLEAALPPCDERIGALYRYWLAIHPARGLLPGRQHFDPVAVPDLLPFIWLADFERHPLRFKYRLIGTALTAALKHDPTGKWLDEVHAHFTKSSGYRQFVLAAGKAQSGFYEGAAAHHKSRDLMTIQRVVLPLASTGYDVDLLLGLTVLVPIQRPSTAGSPTE
jgi:hypothetical protein